MIKIKQDHAFVFIIMAIIFQASSGIFSKYASLHLESQTIVHIIMNSYYLLSLLCLILQAFVWQQALKHYDLSFAYPFVSLVNFVILLSSYILFDESITLMNIIGLAIISLGICLLARKEAIT